MDASAWPEENWAVLGEQIASARRAKGWDQAELARQSGNSPNTISNYERGRTPRSRRVPSGLIRVSQALGWPPDAARQILAGEDPEVALNQLMLDFMNEGGDADVAPPVSSQLMNQRDVELTQSGHLAQDTFIRQMKRFRNLVQVSIEELAKRVAELGGDLELKELARLENGTRLLKMSEAEVIARALDTTVDWLLGSGFLGGVPDEMQAPPTDEELQVEAKAVERRIFETGTQVNAMHAQYSHARQREEDARQQTQYAFAIYQQTAAQQAELERQYQYLLGRIDSLRAAKGEELIIQAHFVASGEVTRSNGDDASGRRTVGAQLADARYQASMTLEQLSHATRVRISVLQSIEQDRFEVCGGDVYARGHIRTVARALDIDPAPLLAQYDAERGGRPAPPPKAPLFTADTGEKPRKRVVRIKKPKSDQ